MSRMSKIGKSILIIVCVMIALVTIILTVTFLVSLNRTETSSLKMASQVAANVFQHDFDSSADDTVTLAELLAADENLLVALNVNDTNAVETVWNGLHKNEGIFAFFTNADGLLLYKTDNCTVSNETIFNMSSGSQSGLYMGSSESLFYCTSVLTRYGAVAVGYSYSSDLLVDNIKAQTDAQATIFADNLRIATTVTKEDGERAIGTTMLDNIYDTVIRNGQIYQQETEIFGQKYMATYLPLRDGNGNVRGALFTGAPMEQSLKNRFTVTVISVSLGVVMLAVASFVFLRFVTVHISQPVAMVKVMATEMEIGNLRGNPGLRGKVDDNEIGDLARALASAITTLDGYVGDISDMMKEMSDGNFGYQTSVSYKGDFINIGQSAEALHQKMKSVVNAINGSADEVYNGSEQISNVSSIIADGTTKQAAASEELSASMEEITGSINLTVESVEKTMKLSHTSLNTVNNQSSQIRDMLSAMENIEESTGEISKIIQSIEDIAFQTNILALNAAVEAARAGEAGKGFAVVADEVRNLATKSAEAAKNTSALIESCIAAVNNGSDMAHRTAQAMSTVVDNVNNTNKLIDDINVQTAKQAEAVAQVKAGIDSISEVVQQNSATAQECAANCQELNSQAMNLREQIAIFHT